MLALSSSVSGCCCKPQFGVRPGSEPGLATLPGRPFPLLSQAPRLGIGDQHLLLREMLIPGRKLGVPGTCQLLHALSRGAQCVFIYIPSPLLPRALGCPQLPAAQAQCPSLGFGAGTALPGTCLSAGNPVLSVLASSMAWHSLG